MSVLVWHMSGCLPWQPLPVHPYRDSREISTAFTH